MRYCNIFCVYANTFTYTVVQSVYTFVLGFLIQVIHYDLPSSSEIFVHRSGRTGRAGKKGAAILIYSEDQFRTLRTIERDVGCKFTEVIFLFFHMVAFFAYIVLVLGAPRWVAYSLSIDPIQLTLKGHWNVVPL